MNFKKKRKRQGSESDYSDDGLGGGGGGMSLSAEDALKKEEDDASKRRSGRNTARKKYVDELDINLSDEEHMIVKDGDVVLGEDGQPKAQAGGHLVYVDPNSEDTMVIQTILAMRMGEREIIESDDEEEEAEKNKPQQNGEVGEKEGETKGDEDKSKAKKKPAKKIEVEEFYVKYRAFSYIHCEWRTEEELMKGDKRANGKIKRFKQKRQQSQNIMDFLEEDSFNPDYLEVDRILDCTESVEPETKKVVKHYLVKWKSLPYEDCTWEVEEDVDAIRVSFTSLFA